jgi:hypothetical protein
VNWSRFVSLSVMGQGRSARRLARWKGSETRDVPGPISSSNGETSTRGDHGDASSLERMARCDLVEWTKSRAEAF